jgi:hypothetical protein
MKDNSIHISIGTKACMLGHGSKEPTRFSRESLKEHLNEYHLYELITQLVRKESSIISLDKEPIVSIFSAIER